MSETRKLLLKPASFQSSKNEQNGSNSSENGGAARLIVNNPFLKCEKDEPEASKQEEKSIDKDPAKQTTANNLFQPAKTNFLASGASSAFTGGNSSFIFGQHLAERVVIDNSKPASSEENNSNENSNEKDSSHLFSNAITSSKPPESDNAADGDAQIVPESVDENNSSEADPIVDKSMSLVEAARKYEEMRGAQKRKYEEVEITTGEEDERNILEINCKLFTFIENNYEERGRGILRLNDSKSGSHSRVVFRASGSLRLLLNTKVWRDQICEQPSQKSLRLTAFDTNGLVKIYLAMGRVEDMALLNRALNSRIQKEKERTPEPEDIVSQVEKVEEAPEDSSDEPETKRKALDE